MKRALAVMAFAALAVPCLASAAPLKKLKVVETTTIKASPDKVWDTIKDFNAIDRWHPGISKDEIIKGENNKPGAVRQLTIKDGPQLKEQLVAHSDTGRFYTYKIVESPLPVDHYMSTIKVTAKKDGTSLVRWSGSFTRKNTSDNPPEAENDDAAVKLITGVYHGGLANLKKMLEGG
ncbi:MAG: SRPBCC family protein [Steroidobacteraceae bacterium]